ncbi:hypothetical protein LSAT2_011547 [Lamellibrachia satsuma]|nr:hypothetical protein LSAT2_011547 [Lamellibrachia satsuma]
MTNNVSGWVKTNIRKLDAMAKFFVALLVLVAVYAAEADYNGCFNGFNYDCCRNRRPNVCYPSLSKPMPYYYKCVGMKVVYGRCEAAERITVRGTPAGRRPCATDAAATSSASRDVPFATSDAPGTDATTTADVVVVSAGATTAVATDKQRAGKV